MGIDADDLVNGWEGALRTILARAGAATGADRGSRREIFEVETFCVDGAVGVASLAAQANGEKLIGIAKAALMVLYLSLIHI